MAFLARLLTLATAVSALPQKPEGGRHGRGFRYLGRVNPATRELTWPATGIEYTYFGSSEDAPVSEVTGTNSINIAVDDGAPVTVDNFSGSAIIPANGSLGHHSVEVRKKSEALYGSIFLGDPQTIDTAGRVGRPRKNMEIIGDSISCGYGIEGTFPCTQTADLEDGTSTYGALTAEAIDAAYSIVAWSGKGLIRNTVSAEPNQPLMPELWTRYGANDPDNSYPFDVPMDIVVINLGTNDFSYTLYYDNGTSYAARPEITEPQFANATIEFGKRVQSKYPQAEMFLLSSPMLSGPQHTTQSNALIEAVGQLGPKAHFVNIPPQDRTAVGLGCDYHPSRAEHEVMAEILTSAIQEVCG